MRMRHITIRGLSRTTIFFPRYLTNGTIVEKNYWIQNVCVCVEFLCNFWLKHFSF